MMKRAPLAVLVLATGIRAAEQSHACPPYQSWGGIKCEWVAYCPDGRPWRGRPCNEPEPQPQPEPQPPRPAPVTPAPAPVIPTPAAPVPPPRCTHGQVLRNGICVCPDGYTWDGANCKPEGRECDIRSLFAASRGKKILLVNGRALDLFQRYIGDLELEHAQPDYETLRVYLYGQDGRREELRATLTMGDLFLGTTYKDKWRRVLRSKVAADRQLPQEDAKVLHADLICGQR